MIFFKKISKFILIFFLFFNLSAQSSDNSQNTINLISDTLDLKTNIYFFGDYKLNSLNNFDLISQVNNESVYKSENHKLKIIRTIIKSDHEIIIEDNYENKTNSTIGIISNYNFSNFSSNFIKVSGKDIKLNDKIYAENPTILIKNDNSSIGIYLNDEFTKINSLINTENDNSLNIYNNNLIIKPLKKYNKSFRLNYFDQKISYHNYINFLRKKLNVYSYLDGNLIWLDTYKNRKILKDKNILKNFITNYGIKYIIITPWLDYDNYDHKNQKRWSRDEYKHFLINVKNTFKDIDPNLKLLTALQSNVISIDNKIQDIINDNNLNEIRGGFNHYKLDFSHLDKLGIEKDEIITDQNNQILFETYYHDWKYNNSQNLQEIALALKAYKGGHLYNKLIDQINFSLNEIKFDGVYIDQFNQHHISPNHTKSFDGLNTNIGQIDDFSGKIIEESENVTLNTFEFQRDIINFLLSRTNHIFFNTHHIDDSLRKAPVIRFFEGFWYFWVEKLWEKDSNSFFEANSFFSSHLSTPVSLSLGTIQKGEWQSNPHNALVKNLKFCLYNGNLMYFLEQDIAKLDISNDRVNIFSKIYPINVKEIYQGTIIGQDKIITIVDLKISKKLLDQFNFFYFDESGYIINNKDIKYTEIDDEILIHLNNEEILVLERKNE